MIKISIRDITSQGLDIDKQVPKEEIGLEGDEVDIRSALSVKAYLQKADNFIIADTRLKAEFGYQCARCLEDISLQEERKYKFNIEVGSTSEFVDVGEEIRQELILANPARILCKKSCKGICPACGANLNREKCKCKK